MEFQVGDPFPFRGACGHRLIVDDLTPTRPAGESSTPDDAKARYFYLRCVDRQCERLYRWTAAYGETPRPLARRT